MVRDTTSAAPSTPLLTAVLTDENKFQSQSGWEEEAFSGQLGTASFGMDEEETGSQSAAPSSNCGKQFGQKSYFSPGLILKLRLGLRRSTAMHWPGLPRYWRRV